MPSDKELRLAGIPAPQWGRSLDFPSNGHDQRFNEWTANITDNYEDCRNLLIAKGNRDQRVGLMCWLAQHVMTEQNAYTRAAVEYKHHIPAYMPGEETLLTSPYTVRFMDVEGLRDFYQERDGLRFDVDEPTFSQEVVKPDFFFLAEIGYEWANRWFAKLILDLLIERDDAKIPTVVSITTPLSKIVDKHERYVYSDVATFINEKFVTKVALSK